MTQPMNSWLRFVLAAGLLVGVGIFLHARGEAEDLPPRTELTSLPRKVGNWVGEDAVIPPEVLLALGPGEFLSRIYRRTANEPHIDFFLAYFPSQRTGDTIHSPKNCLPGAGWAPIESGRIHLAQPGGAITVNRYLIARGLDRLLVLYWYQAHGRTVASEYWAKFYLVGDAIRMHRTDGALVRIASPVAGDGGLEAAQQRAIEFARQILPLLPNFIPD